LLFFRSDIIEKKNYKSIKKTPFFGIKTYYLTISNPWKPLKMDFDTFS